MQNRPELTIVIPVYNEEASIAKVIHEWFDEISRHTDDFIFYVIDDGSKDSSLEVLNRLADELGPRLQIHSRPNRGHGMSCLEGYEHAAEIGSKYVFQIDSDGQCDPAFFQQVWELREKNDVVYGWRRCRDDGWRRVVASRVLRGFVLVLCGAYCIDANTPYRLMQVAAIQPVLTRLKERPVALTNVALAVLLRKLPEVRQAAIPIRFRERYGGEPSVRLIQFAAKAKELARELRAMG